MALTHMCDLCSRPITGFGCLMEFVETKLVASSADEAPRLAERGRIRSLPCCRRCQRRVEALLAHLHQPAPQSRPA